MALVMSFVTTSLTTEVMTTDVIVYGTQVGPSCVSRLKVRACCIQQIAASQ